MLCVDYRVVKIDVEGGPLLPGRSLRAGHVSLIVQADHRVYYFNVT